MASKKKAAGFSISEGVIDYLNAEYFHTNHALTLYLRLLYEAQKESNAGKGIINILSIVKDMKISTKDLFDALDNLQEINFVNLELVKNKDFLHQKGLEIFSTGKTNNSLIKSFLFENNCDDSYLLGIKFFSEININQLNQYLDLIFLPKLKFNYIIEKYKDFKDIKPKIQFEKDVNIVINHFEKMKSWNNQEWKQGTSTWRLSNKLIVEDMLREYRKRYSPNGNSEASELICNMINCCFSMPWYSRIVNHFSQLRNNDMIFLSRVEKFKKIIEKIDSEPNTIEKTRRMIKILEKKLDIKLSPAHEIFFIFYFEEVIYYKAQLLMDAINFIARKKYYDKDDINLEKIVKYIKDYAKHSK